MVGRTQFWGGGTGGLNAELSVGRSLPSFSCHMGPSVIAAAFVEACKLRTVRGKTVTIFCDLIKEVTSSPLPYCTD